MTRTLILAASIVLAALLLARSLASLSAQVHEVSANLAALKREVGEIGEDVQSLADDVATIADSLAGEDEDMPEDEPSPSDATQPPSRFRRSGGGLFVAARACLESAPRGNAGVQRSVRRHHENRR